MDNHSPFPDNSVNNPVKLGREALRPSADMPLDFWHAIEPHFSMQDGWWIAPWQRVHESARNVGLTPNMAERLLVRSGICPSRYLRNLRVLGLEGQYALLASSIFIGGCGGLGGRIAEMLVRAGVGTLTLVDYDHFSDNNLNRQIACTENTLGQYKCLALKAHLEALNSATHIMTHCVRITHDNVDELAQGASLLVDGFDDLLPRHVLLRAAHRLGCPFIHGSVENWSGQAAIIYPGSPQGALLDSVMADILAEDAPSAQFASPPSSVSMVAALEVTAIFHVVCGKPTPLERGMLQFDLESMAFIVDSLC